MFVDLVSDSAKTMDDPDDEWYEAVMSKAPHKYTDDEIAAHEPELISGFLCNLLVLIVFTMLNTASEFSKGSNFAVVHVTFFLDRSLSVGMLASDFGALSECLFHLISPLFSYYCG